MTVQRPDEQSMPDPTVFERVFAEGAGIILTDYWRERIEAGFHALATHPDVRAEVTGAVLGLRREKIAEGVAYAWWIDLRERRLDAVVDAILAALQPDLSHE